METIIVAGIGGAVTLIVCIVNNHYQQKQTRNLIEYKLDELTKRVDKHNNVIERVYKLEQQEAVFDEQIRGVSYRNSEIEKDIK